MGKEMILVVLATMLCQRPAQTADWSLLNVKGRLPDLTFSLTNDQGKKVSAQNYRGDVVLVYFGVAGRSSQHPPALDRVRMLMQQLGPDANHTRLLFVTLKPTSNSPGTLHRYLAAFDQKHMVGLTGRKSDIAALEQRMRATDQPDAQQGSDLIYIFDAEGHARLLAMPQDTNEHMLKDVRRLVHEGDKESQKFAKAEPLLN